MSTTINLKFEKEENDKENEKKKMEMVNDVINTDIKNELKYIQNKEKTFVKLWRLYSTLDKFFMIVNFSTILFSIFISESSLSLALSVYTLSFSMIFDTKRYIPILEKLIILYQDEIIPEINKCIRKYYKNVSFKDTTTTTTTNNNNNNDNDNNDNNNDNYSDIIYELQQIEKDCQSKYLGIYFSIPKRLRSIDWKRIFLVFSIYIISFISLSVACYFKSTGKLQF